MNKKPAPTGPYTVGTTTFTVYTDREELRAPGTKRSVPVRVYYPVQPKAVAGMPISVSSSWSLPLAVLSM